MKSIQYYSVGYNLLRAYTRLLCKGFYKKKTVVGLENIPKDKPVILAINHQNALMDALNTLYSLKQQPVFMARADIFKKKKTASFLRWIKILPIYRIRDGIKSLQNNDAVFEEAIGVLEDKKILALLPEGTHGDKRKLRALKKGIARIAFKAEERNNFKLGVQIIPVGLDYSEYIKTGGELLVNFGKPFDLQQYKDVYLQDEQKGMKLLIDELRSKMLQQMLHISDNENYDEIYLLSNLYVMQKKGINHLQKMNIMQNISNKLVEFKQENKETFEKQTSNVKKISELIQKLNLRNWTLKKEKYCSYKLILLSLLKILFFPLFAVGFITNILPFYLPVFLSKNVKDPQFLSSFRFVLSIIIFTVFYLIYLTILLFIIQPFWLSFLIFILIPILGKFSYKYYINYKKLKAQFKVNKLYRSKNEDYITLRKLWNEINEYFITIKV